MPKRSKVIKTKKRVTKPRVKVVKTKQSRGRKVEEKVATRVSIGSLQASVIGVDGKQSGRVTLPSELFGAKVNKKLLAQAVRVYLANQRVGTASTKTRGLVEGSTRKIYRQKGTGRARHGSIRAPIFVGGGIVFGPTPRDYSLTFPKKMKRRALVSALSSQYQDGMLKIVDGLEKLEPKTKFMAKALTAMNITKPALLVVAPGAEPVERAARNIEDLDIVSANSINPYVLLSHKTVVFMKQAIPVIQETFMKGIHETTH